MVCDHGNQMIRGKEQVGRFVLRYWRCPACGRCDGWEFTGNGVRIYGQLARAEFNRLHDADTESESRNGHRDKAEVIPVQRPQRTPRKRTT